MDTRHVVTHGKADQGRCDSLTHRESGGGERNRNGSPRWLILWASEQQKCQYAKTNGSRGDIGSGDYLSLAELRAAKRTLLNNNARPVKSEGGKFVVITNPNSLYDLEGDSNITNFWQYAGDRGVDSNQLFDVEFRDLPMGFRLYVTTNTRVFAGAGFSAANVVATMVLAEEFYGTSKFDGMPAQIKTHDRGTSGIVDPLDQVASIGWKASWGAVRLNEALGVRIEHNTSAHNIGP